MNNLWYVQTTQEGNYWSDYSGTGNYDIAGFAGTSDQNPLNALITVTTQQTPTDKIPTSEVKSSIYPSLFQGTLFDILIIFIVGGGIIS